MNELQKQALEFIAKYGNHEEFMRVIKQTVGDVSSLNNGDKQMSDLTEFEYNTEINSIVTFLVQEAMQDNDNDRQAAEDQMQDYRLHETIDGHQWVIYYSYNDDVIKHSQNDEYYKDIYDNESIGQIVAEKGIDDFRTMQAFWCMYADVQEKLDESFDAYQEQLEQAFDEFESEQGEVE